MGLGLLREHRHLKRRRGPGGCVNWTPQVLQKEEKPGSVTPWTLGKGEFQCDGAIASVKYLRYLPPKCPLEYRHFRVLGDWSTQKKMKYILSED